MPKKTPSQTEIDIIEELEGLRSYLRAMEREQLGASANGPVTVVVENLRRGIARLEKIVGQFSKYRKDA